MHEVREHDRSDHDRVSSTTAGVAPPVSNQPAASINRAASGSPAVPDPVLSIIVSSEGGDRLISLFGELETARAGHPHRGDPKAT